MADLQSLLSYLHGALLQLESQNPSPRLVGLHPMAQADVGVWQSPPSYPQSTVSHWRSHLPSPRQSDMQFGLHQADVGTELGPRVAACVGKEVCATGAGVMAQSPSSNLHSFVLQVGLQTLLPSHCSGQVHDTTGAVVDAAMQSPPSKLQASVLQIGSQLPSRSHRCRQPGEHMRSVGTRVGDAVNVHVGDGVLTLRPHLFPSYLFQRRVEIESDAVKECRKEGYPS